MIDPASSSSTQPSTTPPPIDEATRTYLEKIQYIFTGYNQKRKQRITLRNFHLAHYTSAENAAKILNSNHFWMRSVRCMNDFREADHGHELLVRLFNKNSEHAQVLGENSISHRFCTVVNECFPGSAEEAFKKFNDSWPEIRSNTYIMCLSEHGRKFDRQFGRLSMWRAYAQTNGVALIFKMPNDYDAMPLRVVLNPVGYFTEQELSMQLHKTIDRISENNGYLKLLPKDLFVEIIYRTLITTAVSLKHPTFSEEREWRLIYMPNIETSTHVQLETETISGVPQIVAKLPLANRPDDHIYNVEFKDLFERVLIGPTHYPDAVRASLEIQLTKSGITQVPSRIVDTLIPLRI